MSRIYHSGSNVDVRTVSFNDLASISKEKGSFFVPKALSTEDTCFSDASVEKPGAEDPKKETKKETSVQKPMDIEKIKEEAFSKGKKAGRLESEKQLHSTTQSLASALEQISRMRESLLLKSREDMLRLIMGVARQVIRAEVRESEQIILDTVTRALAAAVSSDEYYIRVNPEDMDTVTENEPLFFASMKGLRNIHFIADDAIERGGCIAESTAGDVDATIESQLIEIYDHLRIETTPENRCVNG